MKSNNAAFKRYASVMESLRLDSDYAYATGRVKVLEERLIPYAKLRELAAPEQGADALEEALNEAHYPAAASLSERLRLAVAENDALLKELNRNGLLARGLLLQSDLHNLKLFLAYLKDEYGQSRAGRSADGEAGTGGDADGQVPASVADLVFNEAMLPPSLLWQGVRSLLAGGEAAAGQDPALLQIAKDDQRFWRSDYRPAAMDLRLDQAWFKRLGELIEAQPESAAAKFLACYRELLADLLNMQSALRLLRMHASVDWLRDAYVSGGSVQLEALTKAFAQGGAALSAAFRDSAAEPLGIYVDAYLKGEQVLDFGRALSEILLDFARFGLAAGNGPAQLAGYWLARRLEIQNLRIIMAGNAKRNDETFSAVLLRDSYRRGRDE